VCTRHVHDQQTQGTTHPPRSHVLLTFPDSKCSSGLQAAREFRCTPGTKPSRRSGKYQSPSSPFAPFLFPMAGTCTSDFTTLPPMIETTGRTSGYKPKLPSSIHFILSSPHSWSKNTYLMPFSPSSTSEAHLLPPPPIPQHHSSTCPSLQTITTHTTSQTDYPSFSTKTNRSEIQD
jgi:hypothetical protein